MSHRDIVMPEVRKFLDEHNTKGWSMLEIGPGSDVQFKLIFEQEYGITWHGLDQDPKTFDHDSHQYTAGKMESMPFPDKLFDFVFSVHSLEHCEKHIDALREIKRVGKKYIMIILPYHCQHQVLEGDKDHINVLTKIQAEKLFKYLEIKKIDIYEQKEGIKLEQDWNLIAIGKVDL